MTFIVFDGLDSSGKHTQAELLVEYLKGKGKDVELINFPTYQDSPLGIFVAKYLKGEFGSKEDIGPEIGSMIYAIDRYQSKEKLAKKLSEGKTIIADRYITANVFQAAKVEGDERFEVWNWIKQMESRLPQPDVIIIPDVLPEVSQKHFDNRDVKNQLMDKGEKDIHEQDVSYQGKVRQLYLELAEREDWIVVKSYNESGQFRPKQEIHEEILEKIGGRI